MLYQKIFVPFDGSEPSLMALREAVKMAKLGNGKIYVAYAVDFARKGWGPGANVQTGGDLKLLTKRVGDTFFSRAREVLDGADVSYEEIILETLGESIINVLSNQAKQLQSDLIVIGTRSMSSLMHILLGSVSNGVLKKSNIPILMIKAEAE